MIALGLYALGVLVVVVLAVAAWLLWGATGYGLSVWLARRPGRATRSVRAFLVVTAIAVLGSAAVSEGLCMAALVVFCVVLGPLLLAAVAEAEEIERRERQR